MHSSPVNSSIHVVSYLTPLVMGSLLTVTLRGLLPSNPVASMADGNIVAIIIFATFLGLAVKRLSKKYLDIIKPFIDLVEAFYKIIVSVAMTVIKFMPYAVVALLANTITARGLASMISVVQFIVCVTKPLSS